MLTDIKKISLIKKDNALVAVCFLAVALLIGTIIGAISGLGIEIAVVMVTAGYGTIAMFFKIIFLAAEVSRGLGFGMTRKKIFAYSRIYDALELCVVLIIMILLMGTANLSVILKVAVLIFGFIMFVQGLAGNAVVLYGRTAYMIYYFSMLALGILCPKIIQLSGSAQRFAIWFLEALAGKTAVASLGAWGVILAFVLAGIIVNWMTFRKLPVVQAV